MSILFVALRTIYGFRTGVDALPWLHLVFSLLYQFSSGEGNPGQSGSQELSKRFEYKLSFKGPHLVQSDGLIPFWDHYGDTIASSESVRITPSLKSKKGSVWSKETNPHKHWEVEVVFRISGRGRVGADGMAIWYTEGRGQEGPVFGGADHWKGLGIFFDSYDNDIQNNNPYIMVITNDGTQDFNHEEDGTNEILGGCLRDFRNKPFPTRVKIEYYNKALTLHYHNGITNNKDDYEICARIENLELPMNGYFGVSAATGALADDQDVLAFLTHSLIPSQEVDGEQKEMSDEERKKFEQEYNDYREKLDKAREEYKKEHPSKPGEYVNEDEKMYEAVEMREMKMIFDGQNEIYLLAKSLASKLDDVKIHQEKQLSLLTLINQQSNRQDSLGGSTVQPNLIEKHEVNGLITSQKEVIGNIKDVRSLLNEVHLKLASLGQGNTVAQGNNDDIIQHLQDVKNHIGTVQSEVRTWASNPQPGVGSCPSPAQNCVTPLYLFIFLLCQLFCIIGYMIYRSNRDAAAKKFY